MFGFSRAQSITFVVMVVLIVVCPFVLYPVFLMRVLTAALFACAFNLMLGYVGLLSFGHAAFFGMGSYVAAWTMKNWHVDAVDRHHLRRPDRRGAGPGARLSGDPPVRHLFRHDHPGAGADGLLLLPGSAVHRR